MLSGTEVCLSLVRLQKFPKGQLFQTHEATTFYGPKNTKYLKTEYFWDCSFEESYLLIYCEVLF